MCCFIPLVPFPCGSCTVRIVGRKRAPLPPQDIRFHEAVNRPQQVSSDIDNAVPYRPPPPPHLSPSQLNMALPQGPRDPHHQRPVNPNSNSFPSGPRYPPQSQPREIDIQRMMPPSSGIDRDDSGRRHDRRSRVAYAQSFPQSEVVMDVDVNELPSTSSRIAPSPSSRNTEAQAGLRVGAGMYADREGGVGDVLPRGPRAMASKPPVHIPGGGFPPPLSASSSPTTPYVYGPDADAGARGGDRSPPAQQLGSMNERAGYDNSRHEVASGWRDERNHGYPLQERVYGHV